MSGSHDEHEGMTNSYIWSQFANSKTLAGCGRCHSIFGGVLFCKMGPSRDASCHPPRLEDEFHNIT